MNLGLNTVSSTYQFVLNQSGANAITLGDNSAVNWNAGGVVALTGTQTISGSKTFDSPITSKGDIYVTATDSTEGGQISLLGNANTIYLDNYLGHARIIAGSKELVRFKSDGRVGIGTDTPTQTLHVTGSIYANSFTGTFFSGSSFIGNSFSGVNFSGSAFTFPNTLGDKISLYSNGANNYGFGIQASRLQIHTSAVGEDIVFGYGNSSSMTGTMTIKGEGQVAFNYYDSGSVSNVNSNLRLDKYVILKMTPSTSLNALTTTVPPTGAKSTVIISGAGAYTHTFVSPFKVAGTLVTAANKSYTISFVSDGTYVYEQCRAITLG